jgi:hypothetical protein
VKDDRCKQTHRFVALKVSSTSLPFPFVVAVSRERLDDGVEADGYWSADARSFSFSFSFAAFTLALDRNTLVSKLDVELDGSARGGVASCCWVESI